MNKSLLLTGVVILFLLTGKSFGQTTGTANLSITLSSVLSLVVTQPPSVDFNTITRYQTGIISTADDHLTVTSSKGYIVSAISDAITTNPSALTAGSIKLTTSIGGANTGNTTGVVYNAAGTPLPAAGGTPLAVVTAANSSSDGTHPSTSFKVAYNIGSGAQYLGKTLGVNVIPILYSVVEQ